MNINGLKEITKYLLKKFFSVLILNLFIFSTTVTERLGFSVVTAKETERYVSSSGARLTKFDKLSDSTFLTIIQKRSNILHSELEKYTIKLQIHYQKVFISR